MDGLTPADILAERVRARLAGQSLTAKRMFGGLTFMLDGNMLCCASAKGLMVRVGREHEAEALERPHAAPCLGAGRPMAGFIMVSPAGVATDAVLDNWLGLALAYVAALPAKPPGQGRKPAAKRTRGAGLSDGRIAK